MSYSAKQFRSDDSAEEVDQLAAIKRRSRVFDQDGLYYFQTRECINVGPFAQKFDAELSASLLISRLAQLENHENSHSEILRFMHESEYLMQKIEPEVPMSEPVEKAHATVSGLASKAAGHLLQFFAYDILPKRT